MFKSQLKHPVPLLYEIIGWYGVAAILVAYFLLNISGLPPSNLSYQLLNASGALAIMAHSALKKDWQPLLLNAIWLLIAAYGLTQSLH